MLLISTRRVRRHILRQVRLYSQEAKKFDILYMGRDEFSCGVFRELHAASDVWNHITVATQPDEKVGRRGSMLSVSPLKTLGSSFGVPIHTIPRGKKDFRTWPLPSPFSLPPDTLPPSNHLLLTASFGRILPLAMLSQFPRTQQLNVHPSLLPAFRGPAPIQHTLIRHEKETGVCIIGMLPVKKKGSSGGIDAGDVWGCSRMVCFLLRALRRPVPEGIDFSGLRDLLAKEGGRLLVDVLRGMIGGTAKAYSQPIETDAPHAPMIKQADWTINFSQLNAEQIIWRHRAISHQVIPIKRHLTAVLPCNPIRTVQLTVLSIISDPYRILMPSMVPGVARFHEIHGLLIRCKDGGLLQVTRLKREGKREMNAKDWWNGIKGMGLVVDSEVTFR
ncbi:hypothetical protein AGABI1DRAFT_43653 [Agaricus bisporus var. burnettii JB137-S8]|uniref:Methionyl-tRNA formyltransferase n=1 Tax=Agaricus bisporus var. burnettii (strain JB137-S8 / ATCC MYA-4627 / FGSC 10392) TaxID=597362 RepID=K5WPT9_AGABU|nr:uncharacterized protein AGABI1DRAFT_43653 [Agaricus bisporus var. burnettii JB137-S8]EKM77371.1 hypothetical protein AGABI1DRAFT_43653 [Agaricus bisporus var. burnettii JB137-S8]